MKAGPKLSESVTEEHISIYNEFVDVCNENNLRFELLEVRQGESKEGVTGLSFEMELTFGLAQEKANQIFKTFIKNHPECGLSFNTPAVSELEKTIKKRAHTVISVDDGFKLERI
jgi:hypothetical protein